MIQEIAGHSVDMDLINQDSYILDIGCRDFSFASNFGKNCYSIDIDELGSKYYQLAISDQNGWCSTEGDGESMRIVPGNKIRMMTIDSFSKMVGINKWDIIKMDIEGEEIKILKSLKHPYCKQISVEFHAHRGQSRHEIDNLLDWLNQWYNIYNRIWEEKHHAGFNYWDILIIAK